MDIKPIHYDLELNIDKNFMQYNGKINIELIVENSEKDSTIDLLSDNKVPSNRTNKIELNCSSQIKIQNCTCIIAYKPHDITFHHNTPQSNQKESKSTMKKKKNGNKKNKKKKKNKNSDDFVISEKVLPTLLSIESKTSFSKSFATPVLISINFEGTISHHIRGGMHGIYFDPQTKTLGTLFEPQFARYAFPCFDETHLKTTFQLKLSFVSSPKRIALSNTSSNTEVQKKENTIIEYVKIKDPIPLYCIAFTIGDYFNPLNFHYSGDLKNIKLYVLNSSYKKLQGTKPTIPNDINFNYETMERFCEDAIRFSIEFMEKYTKFPMTLVDQELQVVIVPQLPLGGMEHHGCIFILENVFLEDGIDEIMEMIAHEIVHYWFGNRIGLPFWLKEGLAQYFEKNISDAFFKRRASNLPKKKQDLKTESAFKQLLEQCGSVKGTSNTEKASRMFSNAMYNNSCEIIKMMVAKYGESKFKISIRMLCTLFFDKYCNERNFVNLFQTER
mmetsp:Transcript_7604/g.11291  ORF Transcript_7604/g.11291 Transcript_7604/m.11291 type:complete len:501 (+) Transcript_7604:2005-3507(+)